MKILHIIDSLVMGGKERRLLELLKGIGKIGDVQCRLVILSKTVQYPYVSDLGIPMYLLERQRKKDITVFRRLTKICKDFRPDIIQSWESMCSVYAAPIARLLNIRFINAMITNASHVKVLKSRWWRAKMTFPLSHMILANSNAGLSAYNAPSNKSRCIHNGFNFSRLGMIEPSSIFLNRHRIATPKIVGMVASFDRRKDYLSFVRVANRILSTRKDVTFLALGDGPTLDICRRAVLPEVKDRIKFLGRQNRIESYVNLFDIALMLTNPKFHEEGISNSIMEYMAIGKPVIATRGGGTEEIVINDQTGFLVSPNDFNMIFHKIQFLLDNEEKAKSMGLAGQKVIQKSFSIEKMTMEFINTYEACLRPSA